MEADSKKRGAQLNIEELVEAGVLAAAYPLHADGELYSLMDRWIRFGKREVCDDAVKDYFGDRIGIPTVEGHAALRSEITKEARQLPAEEDRRGRAG